MLTIAQPLMSVCG